MLIDVHKYHMLNYPKLCTYIGDLVMVFTSFTSVGYGCSKYHDEVEGNNWEEIRRGMGLGVSVMFSRNTVIRTQM